MIGKPVELPIVLVSVRVYQALLLAYPARFQQEYGSHMMQAFRDCCLRTIRQGGRNGLARLWAVTLLDLIQSAVSEHAQKETEMKKEMKPENIRLAGIGLMIGAVVFSISLVVGYAIDNELWMLPSLLTPFFCMPLFGMGMLALRSRYGEKVGGLAKNILLIGAVLGTITSVVGFFAAGVSELWILIYTGPVILFTGLTWFGIMALYKKPLPRWNFLPLFAGIFYPALLLPQLAPLFNGNWNTGHAGVTSYLLIVLQCIALVILGYTLRSEALRKQPYLPDKIVLEAAERSKVFHIPPRR